MSVLRTLTVILLAAGCAVQGPKDDLAAPSFEGDDAADELSRRLDYRGSIGFGETVEGTYSETGYAGYAFVGREGASVTLSLAGAGNDPMLYVYGPKRGDTWAYVRRIATNDDFDGLDSRVDLDLAADGTYLVLAREYYGDEGSFSLTLGCEGDECRAECAPECPAGAACDMIVCVRAPCPSYCAVDGDEPAPAERYCGTRGAASCNDGEFCDFPESASCGIADHPGVCRSIPTVCTREVAPVCGCDGETYSNRCNAAASGVSVVSEGACESAEGRVCGTRGAASCDAGEFCDFPESASCGIADHPGVCRSIPTVCTREVAPVCGCDGETYTNRCNANARGVSVVSEGACASEPVACVVGGCSSQVCTEDTGEPIITTCEFRPEYACLRESRCERQGDGACGWTPTAAYQMCIDEL